MTKVQLMKLLMTCAKQVRQVRVRLKHRMGSVRVHQRATALTRWATVHMTTGPLMTAA